MGAWYISLSKITLFKVDREMDDILVLPGFVETQFVNYKTYQETIILARLTMPNTHGSSNRTTTGAIMALALVQLA